MFGANVVLLVLLSLLLLLLLLLLDSQQRIVVLIPLNCQKVSVPRLLHASIYTTIDQ